MLLLSLARLRSDVTSAAAVYALLPVICLTISAGRICAHDPGAAVDGLQSAVPDGPYERVIVVPEAVVSGRDGDDDRGPLVNTRQKDGGHIQSDLVVYLDAFNNKLTLDLHLNTHLFGSRYVEKSFGYGGAEFHHTVNHGDSHCFYHGSVRGHQTSTVALSTCTGLRGTVMFDGQVYNVEPVDTEQASRFLSSPHYVYRNLDASTGPANISCDENCNTTRRHSSSRSKRSLSPQDEDVFKLSRYVELYVVNDFAQYNALGRSMPAVVQRTKDIVNVVSGIYRQMNIYVLLVGIEVWSEGNRINISGNPDRTMNEFIEYRRNSINPKHRNDNAQLIIGEALGEGLVGKAPMMSICTHQHSGGVSSDRLTVLGAIATTVAHELGHNFGLKHDDDSSCGCPETRCIMSSSGSGWRNPTRWSECSRQEMADAFHQGMDYCLRDLPPDGVYGGAICGNGMTEEGEECDCGRIEDCDNKCCDAATCRLAQNATCGSGGCCDLAVCQPKPAATECRAPYGDCDLGEYCDGASHSCPSDAFVKDGVECQLNGVSSYCYKGRCHTGQSQCQMLWGSTGSLSHPLCFEHFNIMGNANGHCGYNWATGKFQRCSTRDVMCGMLHCTHASEKLMFWKEALVLTMPDTYVHTQDKVRHDCKAAILDVGLDLPDPGMAFDGTKCGEQQICVSRQCVNVTSLAVTVCPDCNQHGVCNNLGQCHCDVGYAPPNCALPGYGGSLHSGPRSAYYGAGNVGLISAVCIAVILTLALLGVAVFCAYHRNNRIKMFVTRNCIRRYCPAQRSKPNNPIVRATSTAVTVQRTASVERSTSGVRRAPSFRPEDISTPRLQSSTNTAISPNATRDNLVPLLPVSSVSSAPDVTHPESSAATEKLLPDVPRPVVALPVALNKSNSSRIQPTRTAPMAPTRSASAVSQKPTQAISVRRENSFGKPTSCSSLSGANSFSKRPPPLRPPPPNLASGSKCPTPKAASISHLENKPSSNDSPFAKDMNTTGVGSVAKMKGMFEKKLPLKVGDSPCHVKSTNPVSEHTSVADSENETYVDMSGAMAAKPGIPPKPLAGGVPGKK